MNRPIVEIPDRALRRRTRRSFLIGGVAAVAGAAGYSWMKSAHEDNGLPTAQRRVMDLNGKLWGSGVDDHRLMPEFSLSRVQYLKPNGDIGLTDPVEDWSLDVTTNAGPDLSLEMADIQSLPPVELVTRFCCIEGWSVISQWKGVRFADFTKKYFPPGKPVPPYVAMSTPDDDYYVGLDIKSALHPQTLLAWELNGRPLEPIHGAPLRLVIPVKYGIKNIKRVGYIEYTSKRPDDYWAEEGYDWFAGL